MKSQTHEVSSMVKKAKEKNIFKYRALYFRKALPL